jgi:glycerophosphoryl diester phosphodiesterase
MKKIILIILIALTSMMTQSQTKIIAHRGFSGIAPENTLIAFQKAIDVGADYFELDVHKSKDNELIVIHDESVDKTSSNGRTGIVADLNYDELKDIKVGYSSKFKDTFKDEKIPTLKEALEMAKGKIKVCIEIKVLGIAEEVLKTIREVGVKDQVIIFCFSYEVLEKIREMNKTIPILYLEGESNTETIKKALAINANAIGLGSKSTLSKKYIEEANKQGIEVWRWTVDDVDEMKQLIEIGINGLITNYPDKALKIRKSLTN